ncbi:hypothetical protein [Rhodococcus sp. ACS1]|uniref:hypothetical protein n=1 Tax=Rhodococcus sp. ACS1 TaxID=2028570 RepID=UPI0015C79EF7|nr:hypothetical protein [Rhodococcus sp. ACS1]
MNQTFISSPYLLRLDRRNRLWRDMKGSPTPKSTMPKIGASASSLIATIVFAA